MDDRVITTCIFRFAIFYRQHFENNIEVKANYSVTLFFIIQVFSSPEHLRWTYMSIGVDVRKNYHRNWNIQSFHLFQYKLNLLSFLWTKTDSCYEAFYFEFLYIDVCHLNSLYLLAAGMTVTYLELYKNEVFIQDFF